jgi:hypothetical protein
VWWGKVHREVHKRIRKGIHNIIILGPDAYGSIATWLFLMNKTFLEHNSMSVYGRSGVL